MSVLLDRAIKRTLQNQYRRNTQKQIGVKRTAKAVISGGSGSASIAGAIYPSPGNNSAPGVTVAMRNVGRLSDAIYQPDTASTQVISVSGRGSGPGGGSGTYTAGDGINIISNVISVNVAGIIDTDYGFELASGDLRWKPASAGGLKVDSLGAAVKLPSNSGLETDASGLAVSGSIAGQGLAWDAVNRVASVNAGVGLGLSGDNVVVNAAAGLEISGDNVVVDLDHDFVWAGNHTYNDVAQFNATPVVNANLAFSGSNREIQSTTNLSIKPTGDLILDPSNNIAVPDAQVIRSTTIGDAPTNIVGIHFWQPSATLWQLNLNTIKVDQLFARTFTIDEVRLSRGEEYWSKSFGIVETNFNLPADEANVDVWFEDAPGLGAVPIFKAGDWIQIRTIDMSASLAIVTVWFTVVDGDGAGTNDWISRDAGNLRQHWRLKRESGGVDGLLIRKGVVALDAGQVGTGWIHLNALTASDGSGGPYIQMGTMTSIAGGDVPVHTNRIRIGNLNGAAGYATETYGMAAGNDLGLSPSAGTFSGFTLESVNGLRMYNTEINLYSGATKVIAINKADGIVLKQDTGSLDNAFTGLHWYENVATKTGAHTVFTSYKNVSGTTAFLGAVTGDSSPAFVSVQAIGNSGTTSGLSLASSTGFNLFHSGVTFSGNSTNGIRSSATIAPTVDNNVDLGTASLRWRALYVVSLNAGTISGTTLSGAEWEFAGSMVIDANSASNTLVSVANQGAGRADLDVDRNITLGGTIDGVDLSAFKAAYDVHIADPAAHHDPVTAGAGIALTGQQVRVNLGASSGLNTTSGLVVDTGIAGNGLLMTAGVINIVPLAAGGLTANANDLTIKLADDSLKLSTLGVQVFRRGNSRLESGIAYADTVGIYLADEVANDGLEWTTSTERFLRIKLPANSGLVRDTTGLYINNSLAGNGLSMSGTKAIDVNPGLGIEIVSDAVKILLGSPSGLNLTAGLALDDSVAGQGLTISAAKVITPVLGFGLEIDTTPSPDAIRIKLAANSALVRDATGLYVDTGIAGAGMTMTSGVINIIPATAGGLQTNANDISIKLGDNGTSGGSGLTTDSTGLWISRRGNAGTSSGLSITVADGIYIAETLAGDGLVWDSLSTRLLEVGAGNGISVAADSVAVNQAFSFAWTGGHTWTTGVAHFNSRPEIQNDLLFMGSRFIRGDASITIRPTTWLRFDPVDEIFLPDDQVMRSDNVTDTPTGIDGLHIFQPTVGVNVWQMNIGKIKVDELFARTFTVDEVRVDRGEEYWSKSYGIVESDFNLPADEANVDVWFEDAPSLNGAPIFDVGDWILMRIVDMSVGLTIARVWFTVIDGDGLGTNDWVQHDDTTDPERQQWRLKRENGGTTGMKIRKGVVALDAGQVGSGWIYLNALTANDGSGGPYIEMGTMTSISGGDVPVHTGRIRIGNLAGAAGIVGENYGMAAGNSLSLSRTSGSFSGFTITDTEGLRLYSTDLFFYDGVTASGAINRDSGMVFTYDSASPYSDITRGIYWVTNVLAPVTANSSGIEAYRDANGTHLNLSALSSTVNAELNLSVTQSTTGELGRVVFTQDYWQLQFSNNFQFRFQEDGRTLLGGTITPFITAASTVHIYENTASVGATAGLTIEQDGAGDALAQFLLSGGQRWGIGIDNTDDAFKIASGTDLGVSTAMTISTAGDTSFSSVVTSLSHISSNTGGGDPYFRVTNGTQTYTMGLDVSATGVPFVIADATGLGSTLDRFIIRPGGTIEARIASATMSLQSIANGGVATVDAVSYRNSTSHTQLRGLAARGTEDTPLTVVDGDAILRIFAYGYSAAAAASIAAAHINFNIDGEPDTSGDVSDMPGRISFWTTPNGSDTAAERMRINNAGDLGIGTASVSAWPTTYQGINIGAGAGIAAHKTTEDFHILSNAYYDGTDWRKRIASTHAGWLSFVNGEMSYWHAPNTGTANSVITWTKGFGLEPSTNRFLAPGGLYVTGSGIYAAGSGITWNDGANYMSHFSEGTWNPVITTGAPGPTIVYGTRYGRWMKLNGWVTVTIYIQTTSFSGGTGTLFFDLPFSGNQAPSQLLEARGIFSSPVRIDHGYCIIANGASQCSMTLENTDMLASVITTNANQFWITGTYYTTS